MEIFSENIRGAMCYILGFVTGALFLLFDRSPFVRFHAVQSLLTFSTVAALQIILPVFPGGVIIARILLGISVILWAVCIVKASRGEIFKLPVFGSIAEEQLNLPYM
ncbi:DUF4870 domain-containing protein [Archaeoglobus neptunius]|uniref:DUF4870 domain-containing protein n=1 Tax=Archaeoglobus neptunius TaxID=2798580 RepID=UPI0019278AF1|nr:hypothetical protein [Archaeoglobus neptunius]